MRTTIFLFTFLLFLLSCISPTEKKENNSSKINSVQIAREKKEAERLSKKQQDEIEIKLDSLRLSKILEEALKIANENINQNQFSKKFETISDSTYSVETEICLDHHFNSKQSHLIVRRFSPNSVLIDIYLKTRNNFQKIICHEQWALTYVNDTIQDVNGDGHNDFLVNWYGATGCCLKGFSNVYLYQSNIGTFTHDFEFINPTFSPKEKIVRGVCYGHPGETEMYKYQWNGESVDTLEYIYYERDEKGKTGFIIQSDRLPYQRDIAKIKNRLKTVPTEYEVIDGYDWFLDNLN